MAASIKDVRHSQLFNLPNETVTIILLELPTSSLVALSLTCRRCYRFINDSDFLWQQILLRSWDYKQQQPNTSCDSPQEAIRPCSNGNDETREVEISAQSTTAKELVARRRQAWRDIGKVVNDPARLLRSHSAILYELLEAHRQVLPRSRANPSPSRTLASLDTMFPPDKTGNARWATLVYPRATLKGIKQWRSKELSSLCADQTPLSAVVSEDSVPKTSLKRSASSSLEPATKRQRTTESDQSLYFSSCEVDAQAVSQTPPGLIESTDHVTAVATQYFIASLLSCVIDEEKAAELHCRAGIRQLPFLEEQQSMIGLANVEQAECGQASKRQHLESHFIINHDCDAEEAQTIAYQRYKPVYEDYAAANRTARYSRSNGNGAHESSTFQRWGRPQNLSLLSSANEIVYDTGRSSYENAYGPLKPFRTACSTTHRRALAPTTNADADDDNDSDSGFVSSDDEIEILDDLDDPDELDEEAFWDLSPDEYWWSQSIAEYGGIQHDTEGQSGNPFAMRAYTLVSRYSGSKVRNEVRQLQDQQPEEDANEIGSVTNHYWVKHKQIDWILLEAIMVVVQCNLAIASQDGVWGNSFTLPDRDSVARLPRNEEEDLAQEFWLKKIFDLSCNWAATHGLTPPRGKETTVWDWAGLQSRTWAGSIWHLDPDLLLRYNVHLSASPNGTLDYPECDFQLGNPYQGSGQLLELCLVARPLAEQKPTFEEGEEEALTHGPEDLEFPTLRFQGFIASYDYENLLPRKTGRVHGFCRPIYTAERKLTRFHAESNTWLPEIAGIFWQMTWHRRGYALPYLFSGVQCGPPGTRAPILGLRCRGSSETSLLGPWTFMVVDERPWAEVRRCREQAVRRGREADERH